MALGAARPSSGVPLPLEQPSTRQSVRGGHRLSFGGRFRARGSLFKQAAAQQQRGMAGAQAELHSPDDVDKRDDHGEDGHHERQLHPRPRKLRIPPAEEVELAQGALEPPLPAVPQAVESAASGRQQGAALALPRSS